MTSQPVDGGRGASADGPLFLQVVELIEQGIVDGSLAEEAQVPSTNELAAFHRINPATALKGIGLLVADGLLHKRRGVGMFVAPGARDTLLRRRREAFETAYVRPLVEEARRLGLHPDDVIGLVTAAAERS